MPFKKITKSCILCGKALMLKNNRDVFRKKFCSHSCRAKYYAPLKDRIEIKCKVCNKIFEIIKSRKEKAYFCSKGCWAIGHKKREKQKIEKECLYCKRNFIAYKNREKYCCVECGRKAQSESILLNNHFNWQGGISFEPYSVDWTETLRRVIRERDNYTCQLCNQCGNTVHHKNYDKKNCNPNNLITLCRSCNVKVNYNKDYWINYFQNFNFRIKNYVTIY